MLGTLHITVLVLDVYHSSELVIKGWVPKTGYYSHVYLCVVDQVLQGVGTGVVVLELWVVGDGSNGGVEGLDNAAHVDILGVGKVWEDPCPGRVGGLKKNRFSGMLLMRLSAKKEAGIQYMGMCRVKGLDIRSQTHSAYIWLQSDSKWWGVIKEPVVLG